MLQTKPITLSEPIPDYCHATIAGVDEAGRGALAGPVVAAAVLLRKGQLVEGCKDSKALSAAQREMLYDKIKAEALAWAVASASCEEIEEYNILHATMKAMSRAIDALGIEPSQQPPMVLIDGNYLPPTSHTCQAIIKGDARVSSISAASILAKVSRDQIMVESHDLYPQYGFDVHKGYGTKSHRQALLDHGACPLHRKSFKLLPSEDK